MKPLSLILPALAAVISLGTQTIPQNKNQNNDTTSEDRPVKGRRSIDQEEMRPRHPRMVENNSKLAKTEYCRSDVFSNRNGVDGWQGISISSVPSSAHKCDNYEYFLKLGKWHGENPNNICALVSIQILAGYYDTFLNDDFVPEIWDKVTRGNLSFSACGNWKNWDQSPGTGYIGNEDETATFPEKGDSRMTDFLLDYCISNVNPWVTTFGNDIFQQLSCLNYYLGYTGVNSTCNLVWTEGNPNDNRLESTLNLIRTTIDAGRPLIVNGHHHSTVAFAYDDSFVYVHSGYGHTSKVPLSYYTDHDASYSPTAIDINPSGSHSHNCNYYSDTTNNFYCSCGAIKIGNLISLSDLVSVSYDTGSTLQRTLSTPKGTADISTKHARLSSGEIILDSSLEESFLEIKLRSESITSFAIDLMSDFDGPVVPNYEIEYVNTNGLWSDALNLSTFTDLYYEKSVKLQYNLESGIRGIRIKVNHVNSKPKLTIKKLVLAYC